MAVEQVAAFLRYGNVANSVNFPAVTLEPADGHRIGVTNVNVAGMLRQLMSVLADANINVHRYDQQELGRCAYNLIDLDTPPSAAVIAQMQAIDEVLSVRVFDPIEP